MNNDNFHLSQPQTWSPGFVFNCSPILSTEPGILSLQKPSFIMKESIGKAKFMVERTQGTDGTVKVTWTTTDQSAINGKDYHGGKGELTFEHGEQIKYIEIEIIDDKAFEKDETFILELSDPTGGAQLGKIKRTVVTLVNDDGRYSKSISQSRYALECSTNHSRL